MHGTWFEALGVSLACFNYLDWAWLHDAHKRNTNLSLPFKITVKFRILYQINPNTRKPSANVDNAAREKLSVLSTGIPIA